MESKGPIFKEGAVCKRKLSTRSIVVENGPMVVLWVLTGTLIFNIGWFYTLLFAIYIPFSVLWFWRFICTYCANYDTGCCPSGYGKAAAKLFLFRDEKKFKQAFNMNMPMVLPYWILPLLAGGYIIYMTYPSVPIWLWMVFIAAMVDGFVILPYLSRQVACSDCLVRDDCPWAAEGGKSKTHGF